MAFSCIPCFVFLDALRKQIPFTLDALLRHCLFTNEGVLLDRAKK